MKFIENGTHGHPAVALIAIRQRTSYHGAQVKKVNIGDMRAWRRIGEIDGIKAATRDLIAIVPSGDWRRNWRIAYGTAVND